MTASATVPGTARIIPPATIHHARVMVMSGRYRRAYSAVKVSALGSGSCARRKRQSGVKNDHHDWFVAEAALRS